MAGRAFDDRAVPARATARIAAALAIVAAALGASCAALVGFESDYQVVPPDASADVVGTGGGTGAGGSGGSGGSTPECKHDVCVGGPTLDPACDPCVATVCESQPGCCDPSPNFTWDVICINTAQAKCSKQCCGDAYCLGLGNDCSACAQDCGACGCGHSVCATGSALSPTACHEPCVDTVCSSLPQCCVDIWGFLETPCLQSSSANCPDDSCIAAVCADQASCCNGVWDMSCVNLAKTNCMAACDCPHDICTNGPALSGACDPCAAVICSMVDTYCCNTAWDDICINEVLGVCGIDCQG